MKNEIKHTAHSSYRCEYHIVFAPKYRRKVIDEFSGLIKLNVEDNSANFYIFLTIVSDCMTGTCGADHNITGAYRVFCAVVVVECFTLHQVEQLAVRFVYMVANAAAGLQGDVGKQAAFVIEFRGGCKIGQLNGAISAAHILAIFLFAFCCFSDH